MSERNNCLCGTGLVCPSHGQPKESSLPEAVEKMRITLKAKALYDVFIRSQLNPDPWFKLSFEEQDRWVAVARRAEQMKGEKRDERS